MPAAYCAKRRAGAFAGTEAQRSLTMLDPEVVLAPAQSLSPRDIPRTGTAPASQGEAASAILSGSNGHPPMRTDIQPILSQADGAQTFARSFIAGYLTPAFGSLSKSEIDILVFGCLVTAKAIDPDAPIYDIARLLNITPARARSLVMTWQLRSMPASSDLKPVLVEALKKTRFSKDGTMLTFGVESPLLKEEIVARLKRKGVFPDASFAKELVRLPVDAFVEFLDDILDEKVKAAVKSTLVTDKLLPDKSFKALATGILMKLGEKVAGKAGEEVAGALVKPAAERLAGFLSGLLTGNATEAGASISGDDYVEV